MFFFTATINNWKPLLLDDQMKRIVLDSLNWLHVQQRAFICGFVIMPNHIHLLWQPQKFKLSLKHLQTGITGSIDDFYLYEKQNEFDLLSFTAHQFKKVLKADRNSILKEYSSSQQDRQLNFWEERSRTIEVLSRRIAEQKLDYIHHNPLQEKWKLVNQPEEYIYSSASFYILNKDDFGFITHYYECT